MRARSFAVTLPSLALAVACSSSNGGTSGSLQGPKAFPVTSTLSLPGALGCQTPNTLTGDGAYAVSLLLSDASLSALACSDGGFGGDAGVPHLLQLQVASVAFIEGSPSQPALQTGVAYPILNEGVPDEDLCGNVPGGTQSGHAILMYGECTSPGGCTTYWAVSGSVTLTSVSNTSVAGTFSVSLGDSSTTAAPGGQLSGSFSATPCAG